MAGREEVFKKRKIDHAEARRGTEEIKDLREERLIKGEKRNERREEV